MTTIAGTADYSAPAEKSSFCRDSRPSATTPEDALHFSCFAEDCIFGSRPALAGRPLFAPLASIILVSSSANTTPDVLWSAELHTARVLANPTLAQLRSAIDAAVIAPTPTLVALDYTLGGAIEPRAGSRHSGPALGVFGRVAQPPAAAHEEFRLEPLRSEVGRDAYIKAVRRALAYIRDGDVYQVNLAHHLRGVLHGSPRALAQALFHSASPLHACYLEYANPAPAEGGAGSSAGRRAIISLSPELFLDYDARTRRVTTRPMKGTRAAHREANRTELHTSPKDRAELNMIVDLMRNDLGRVCIPGSVRVDIAREIETHAAGGPGAVLQATATISGTLRDHLTLADLIFATFPGGSVTGAPKIRAMQIIDELEASPRGIYCGSMGVIRPGGSATLNIAIRTLTLSSIDEHRWTADYPVGAGIVADSDPEGEWRETLIKAGVLLTQTTIEDLKA